ncbi:hypothetical protein [Nocardioides pantholopis]|uniref:hypothetical protein n=1 Tax=Nocardioides pantholopis TaxID=2483798 RepID=UPI000FDC32B0|nr:hypothetical protein [Nocardioides pantholopis]
MPTIRHDEPIRGQVRLVGYRRVSHGLYLADRGLAEEDEFLRDLRAWQTVLPDGAVFSHVTGARLRGWATPALPEQVPVFAAVEGDRCVPRRFGLVCSRLVRASAPEQRRGLPVDSTCEILLRAARDLGTLDLVIMIDSALACGDLDSRAMSEILASGRPGVRMLRGAWELSSARCESAGESMLRVFHEVMGIAVRPQVTLHDTDGRVIGRADLLVTGTHVVHEYDGAGHRDQAQHRADLRRERAWVGTPYQRRGFVLDDLLNHPGVVMHELDRWLGRPHGLRRLQRWRRLVDNSLYREPGRQRVLNRWRRAMGFDDWGRTASPAAGSPRFVTKPQPRPPRADERRGFLPHGP